MTAYKSFDNRYINCDTPWDKGIPDFNLIQFIKEYNLSNCKALEIGCGTGINTIWLANQGFDTLGIDSSESAIQIAKQNDQNNCRFYCLEFEKINTLKAQFNFVFDRCCFDLIGNLRARKNFAKQVNSILSKDGFWLSLVGNYNDKNKSQGPSKRSICEISCAVEKYFEIFSIKKSYIETKLDIDPLVWAFVMQKREY